MNRRKSFLWAAATVLLLAAALLAGLINSASGQTLPPDQGTPSAAGQAAPDTSLLPVWEDPGVFDTDPDGTLPAGGSVTFTFPAVVAGDVTVENSLGGFVVLYDCRGDTPPCPPGSPDSKTGTTLFVDASSEHPVTVRFPFGGSWWRASSRGDAPTTFADLACQQVADGCLLDGPVDCWGAVDTFLARWSAGRLDVQVAADPAATTLRGGPRYDLTAVQRVDGGLALDYCQPAPPTPTPTRTPTATATTQPPTVTPSPTRTPTATPTTPPICEGAVIRLSRRAPGGSWVAFGDPNGYPPAAFWYGLPPYHYTWEIRFEMTGRAGVTYRFTHVEVNGAGQAQRPNPFTWGPFDPYRLYHFMFRGTADGMACGQWDFGGNADPILHKIFLPFVTR